MDSINFSTSTFLPEQEVPVLLHDISRIFRQLGVQFVRASVVELDSMALQRAWSISESGEVSDSVPDHMTVGSGVLGAASSIRLLVDGDVEQAVTQKLSPRRWVYAWRRDERHAVLAEVQYRDQRDASTETDSALVRMVCNASIRRSGAAVKSGAATAPTRVWPHVERRSRSQPSRMAGLTVGLAGMAGLLAGWVALWGTPLATSTLAEQRQQAEQLRTGGDALMKLQLSAALATGDYGEAQTELDQFQQAGYFQSAVVSNAKARVVAMGGTIERQRIGDPVVPEYSTAARKLDLVVGTEPLGQLLLVSASPPSAPSLLGLRIAAALASLGALATAVLLAMRLLRRKS